VALNSEEGEGKKGERTGELLRRGEKKKKGGGLVFWEEGGGQKNLRLTTTRKGGKAVKKQSEVAGRSKVSKNTTAAGKGKKPRFAVRVDGL